MGGISDVLHSFVDNFIEKSHYLVFDKPLYSQSVNLKSGYRPDSRSTGSDRRKSLNWNFQFISPSKTEMDGYIKRWVTVKGSNVEPQKPEEWNQLLVRFMDDFIQEYLITEQPQINKGKSYFLGYRPSKDRSDSKVNFHIKFVQPSRDELEYYIKNWIQSINNN